MSERQDGGLSRRSLLKRASALGAGLFLGSSSLGCDSSSGDFVAIDPGNQQPTIPPVNFPQPPVLTSQGGVLNWPVSVEFATNALGTPNGVRNFRSRTLNGTFNPPTLRLRAGDQLRVPITNNLPPNPDARPPDENTPHHFNNFNLHTHGFHVSPGQDNVLLNMRPGESFTYVYDLPNDHPDGHFWYHPHKHGATAMHLFSGMSGSILIDGALNQVPEVAAAADLVFNIQELLLDGFRNEPTPIQDPYEVTPYTQPNAFSRNDGVFVVNGEFEPTLECRPGQVIRLRTLNASARTTLPLTIQGHQWHILAQDGLTLPAVRTSNQFTLAPANRVEACFKIDTPGTYEIAAEPFTPGGGGATPRRILARVVVAGDPFEQQLPSGALPASPTLPDIGAGEVTEGRTLTYAVGPGGPEIPTGGAQASNFTINGVRFNGSTINQTIQLGSVVEWTLTNTSNAWHPHHIHIHPFQVVATSDGLINGDPNMPLTGPVWMDTVAIPPMGSVTCRQRFPDFPGLFVLHCHILVHEDIGMMQLVNVV